MGLSSAPVLGPLDGALRRAGAHMVERDGWMVAADFGSMASEVAVCRARAGLADVSSAVKLELRGPADAMAALHPGGPSFVDRHAAHAGDAWWCPVSSEVLLVVGDQGAADAVRSQVEERVASTPVHVADVTAERVALALAGPKAAKVLEAVGAGEADEGVVRSEPVAGVPAIVVRQGERRWLLVAAASDATGLWQALSERGGPFGLAHVGVDALHHLDAANQIV